MAKGRRTFQGKGTRRRARVHGFLSRTKRATSVLKNRRAKGRKRLTLV